MQDHVLRITMPVMLGLALKRRLENQVIIGVLTTCRCVTPFCALETLAGARDRGHHGRDNRLALYVAARRTTQTQAHNNVFYVAVLAQHRYFVTRCAECVAFGSPKRASAQARVLSAADRKRAGLTPLGAEKGLASNRLMK